jgi:hypothetical protein
VGQGLRAHVAVARGGGAEDEAPKAERVLAAAPAHVAPVLEGAEQAERGRLRDARAGGEVRQAVGAVLDERLEQVMHSHRDVYVEP